jgi:uncharacterized protein
MAMRAMSGNSAYDQKRLVASLLRPAVYGAGCERVRHIETHISHVLLTGTHAYKIKKPVDLGFLDFTTLARRKLCCDEELRLNRRLAPQIYLDVVAITGTVDEPAIGGDGPVVEYAVRMREFAQEALASRMLECGLLSSAHIDALAAEVADFHARIASAVPETRFGTPATVLAAAQQNFAQVAPLLARSDDRATLDALSAWTMREHATRLAALDRRRHDGFIRECHGDLHLGNIAAIDGAMVVFDCIEFNPELRWIDVLSEVAFTVMDLADRGRGDFAHRFLDAYLERTGDYAGLAVLAFYLVYRALVRAKIACMRAAQLTPGDDRSALVEECRGYLNLAARYAGPRRPALVITHGLAGCGKTTWTRALVEATGAIRVRTDIERKRLHGVAALARSGSAIGTGLYTTEATKRTYRRALALADDVIAAGRAAIVDGTFLERWQRDLFRERATALGVPFAMVAFAASDATLERRIVERAQRTTDASEADLAVLDAQRRAREPLADDERRCTVDVDGELPPPDPRDAARWQALSARLALGEPLRS